MTPMASNVDLTKEVGVANPGLKVDDEESKPRCLSPDTRFTETIRRPNQDAILKRGWGPDFPPNLMFHFECQDHLTKFMCTLFD